MDRAAVLHVDLEMISVAVRQFARGRVKDPYALSIFDYIFLKEVSGGNRTCLRGTNGQAQLDRKLRLLLEIRTN